jgi:16S rRNA (guanine966-N2)-methyltransferase
LFSALESDLGTLAGRTFLDLYAGSGGVGLEAWSRGAARVVLVEQAPGAVAVIRRNIATLKAADVDAVASSVERQARRTPPGGHGFDVAYADAPYELDADALGETLAALATHGWFTPGGRVIVERDRRSHWAWPSGFDPLRDRTYGETMLWYGSVGLPEEE